MLQIEVPSIDRVVNTPVVQPTASNVPLVTQGHVPTTQKTQKTAQQKIQKTDRDAPARCENQVVEVPVVMQDRCV